VDVLKTAATTLVLLVAGALIGSFWVEWREPAVEASSGSGLDFGAPAAEPLPEEGTRVPALERRLKIEVLNGTGQPGAARVVGEALIAAGYDVVAVENADHFDYEVTHVIDRSGVGDVIGEIAAAIGADSAVVVIDRDLFLDATVVLGRDWRRRLDSTR
jgi:hypothetical protein